VRRQRTGGNPATNRTGAHVEALRHLLVKNLIP
jgi:hypothetical protein